MRRGEWYVCVYVCVCVCVNKDLSVRDQKWYANTALISKKMHRSILNWIGIC